MRTMKKRRGDDAPHKSATIVEIDSRPLVTIFGLEHIPDRVRDALVRFYPFANMTALERRTIVDQIRAKGAIAVRIQPAIDSEAPVLGEGEECMYEDATVPQEPSDIRSTVMEVASQIHNVSQETLVARLDVILSSVNL